MGANFYICRSHIGRGAILLPSPILNKIIPSRSFEFSMNNHRFNSQSNDFIVCLNSHFWITFESLLKFWSFFAKNFRFLCNSPFGLQFFLYRSGQVKAVYIWRIEHGNYLKAKCNNIYQSLSTDVHCNL